MHAIRDGENGMRRLLIGFGASFFLLATIVLAVPFLLPKDAIKARVVAEVDHALGWRLRLDGPVSLSLFPGFSLIAQDVGLSGEAGADGIEFANTDKIEFGLAWGGLFGGDIRVTGIFLSQPDILLEVDNSGLTSWEPRRSLFEENQVSTSEEQVAEVTQSGPSEITADVESVESTTQSILKRIGVDRIEITDGRISYSDRRSGEQFELSAVNVSLTAPDLEGEVGLDSQFVWQEMPLTITGQLEDPLAFAGGEQVPLSLLVSSGDTNASVAGSVGLDPPAAELILSASGPSVSGLAASFGSTLARDPGTFSISARLSGDESAFSLADLKAAVGSFALDGSVDANLTTATPEISGRIVLREGSLADLLALAGQDLDASGALGADFSFDASGQDMPTLLATLDLNGSAGLQAGQVNGLGLASAVGGDESANSLKDMALTLDIDGLDDPVSLTGTMSWRGEPFTVTGNASPAPLLAGVAAPVAAKIKGSRLTAGFEGRASAQGKLEGAVSLETADLRSLLAWVGQPIDAGAGLKAFKVSGIFAAEQDAISFDETSFMLDRSSGQAKGRVTLGGKPSVIADLKLRTLVLDPYLTAPDTGEPSTSGGSGGASTGQSGGWSDAPIDFSGLKAVDVDFSVSSEEIIWNKIQIGQSTLRASIKGGVLSAELERLGLYGGTAAGEVTLDGTSASPELKAQFSMQDLDAYPVLRDVADFDWIEGTTFMMLDVTAAGASQRQLVQSLNGAARFEFADGAIRGINLPKMVRGLSVETLLGWQSTTSEKTDFSTLAASFQIANGIATTNDLSLVGPLVRMTGGGTTNMPERTLDWRVEPKIVPTLEGQAPTPRAKGTDKKMAGLGVPIIAKGPWDNPNIYPDIAGILQDPAAAYKQLQGLGGELVNVLNGGVPEDSVVEAANDVIQKATGGRTQIDVKKVLEGDVNDQDVLKAVEEGFGLPKGLLGSFGVGNKKN